MTSYKLFLLRDGELVVRLSRAYSDDLDALDAARALCRDYVVEVYDGIRFVARVKADDEPLNMKDRLR